MLDSTPAVSSRGKLALWECVVIDGAAVCPYVVSGAGAVSLVKKDRGVFCNHPSHLGIEKKINNML